MPETTARRDFLKVAGLALGAGAGALGLPRRSRAADRVEITFAAAKWYGKETIRELTEAYNQAQSKVHVTHIELPPPSSSTEVHQALVQQLARKSGSPDVFTQDCVWVAEFAGAGWALPLDQYVPASARGEYFPGTINTCTWDGKLTALPWMVDSGMLYYRKDLLEKIGAKPPETWDDMVTAAQALQKSGDAKFGFLWQGKQAEVLVCDLVSFIGSNGGAVLGPDGKQVLIAEPPAVEAVQFMYDTINKLKISPSDVLSWDEEPSRRPFTGGQAAFLRNWSYVYAIAQDPKESSVVDKVGIVPLPHFPGKSSAGCLGGYQYGVNASSKNREAAVDFVTWMSSPAIQLRFAIELGIAPTRPAVYDDPSLIKNEPFLHSLSSVFVGATPRPVTPKYSQVSLALQSAVSRALANGNVKEELESAKTRIAAIVA
jgi:multiple sugar transport system substrate-binding protein